MDDLYINTTLLTSTLVTPEDIQELIVEGIINEDLEVLDPDELYEWQEINRNVIDSTYIVSSDISS